MPASGHVADVRAGRGWLFGFSNFGVNFTEVALEAVSALGHAHSKQDEFVYILRGKLVLQTTEGDMEVSEDMCAGFKAGTGNAHRLVNHRRESAAYLEVGDRSPEDSVSYLDDDLNTQQSASDWDFTHKDGTPYF